MRLQRPHLRVLHTSDVHLGAFDVPGGEDRRGELEAAFRRVIDIGLAEDVDLALIAGDFFDNARVHDETLSFAASELARLPCPVVICPGNHDHVGQGSVYDRMDLTALAPNLTIIREETGETIAFSSLGVEVWGKPHFDRPGAFRPFANVPPRGDAPWQIGIGHGHYLHPGTYDHYSFHISQEDLKLASRDYVALGHWDVTTCVAAGENSIAAYSGAPIGLGGHIDGFALVVDLAGSGEVSLTAVSLTTGERVGRDQLLKAGY